MVHFTLVFPCPTGTRKSCENYLCVRCSVCVSLNGYFILHRWGRWRIAPCKQQRWVMLMKWGQSDERGESFWLSASGIDTEINLSAQCWANLSTLQNSSEMEGWRGQVLNTKSLSAVIQHLEEFCWHPEVFEPLTVILACRFRSELPCFCVPTFAEVRSFTRCVAVVPAGGSLPVCAACKQRIYDEQYLQALNSDWHAICFRYVAPVKHPGHKLCLFIEE